MRIVIAGGGRQGAVIARNLIGRPEKPAVVIADLHQSADLPKGTEFVTANVLDKAQAHSIAKNADAVILAVPSEIAHDALANLIEAGAPIADVSFTPDPPLSLNHLAEKSGACCVVDCGIAPGLSHILVGSAYTELGGLDSVKIFVGGMPQQPPKVFEHAVYFNPHDLLAEYIRPARARRNGVDIGPAPLEAEIENIKDSDLGNLEAFISDGLRSLLTSYPQVQDMAEMTLRWKGHLETMRNLRALGMFDEAASLRETANTLATRFPADKYPDVLLMIVEATRGNKRRAWRLIDRRTDGNSAMSRTTGYTTAAVAMALAKKQFVKPGVHPPERLGENPGLAKSIVDDIASFGVKVSELVTEKV